MSVLHLHPAMAFSNPASGSGPRSTQRSNSDGQVFDSSFFLDTDFSNFFTPDMLYNLPSTESCDITTEDIMSLLSQPVPLDFAPLPPTMMPPVAPTFRPKPAPAMPPLPHSFPKHPQPQPKPVIRQQSTDTLLTTRNPLAMGADEGYTFIIDTPVSIAQRRKDCSLAYINKGGFYSMRGRYRGGQKEAVRTCLYILFQGEQKPREREGYWKYWRDLQPQPDTARALEVDVGRCIGVSEVTYPSFNGIEFTWVPAVGCVVPIKVNCLSTDFTAQKGVKGIALQIQVDVWDRNGPATGPVLFRAFSHLKVFRDKGAERKHKDEQKTAEKRLVKYTKQTDDKTQQGDPFYAPSAVTVLTPASCTGPRPTELYDNLFKPDIAAPSASNSPGVPHSSPSATTETASPITPPCDMAYFHTWHASSKNEKKRSLMSLFDTEGDAPVSEDVPERSAKVPKRRDDTALTLYLRGQDEETYNALFIDPPCLNELTAQICARFGIAVGDVRRVLKRTKKGLLVKVDDAVVARTMDESDYVVEIEPNGAGGGVAIVLLPGEGIE